MNTTTSQATVSIEKLLGIPEDQPERLFERDDLKRQYRQLLKQWHPDVNASPRASEAVVKIGCLYEKAVAKDSAGLWERPNYRLFIGNDNIKREIFFRVKRSFELGEILIGDTTVTYLLNEEYQDLYQNAKEMMSQIRFADEAMKKTIEPFTPHLKASFSTLPSIERPTQHVLVFIKKKSELLLSDVINHFNQELDLKHAAWILSCLYNLSCWIAWSKISHQSLSPENIFISPEDHSVSVIGGWWYAKSFGERIRFIPGRTAMVLPSDVLRNKIADPRTDLTLIRRIGREMLGDLPGRSSGAPKSLLTWLHGATAGDAFAEYKTWSTVREATLGPRKFTPLVLSAEDLYPDMPIFS